MFRIISCNKFFVRASKLGNLIFSLKLPPHVAPCLWYRSFFLLLELSSPRLFAVICDSPLVPIAALAYVYTRCRWTQCGAQNNLLYFLRFLAPSQASLSCGKWEEMKKKSWWEENFESSRARAVLSNGVIIAKFIWRKSLLFFSRWTELPRYIHSVIVMYTHDYSPKLSLWSIATHCSW